jgi:putative methanogenesis marker protein 1
MVDLGSCIKRYKKDTHRALRPEETLSRIESKLPLAGITRVADITNLDRIGIPVFTSIRPTSEFGAITVYNGKGATPIEAKVSAMMEGIERFSAEVRDRKLIFSRFSDLKKKALNPKELILPEKSDPDSEIPWVMGYDILNNEEIFVPANAVFFPMSHKYKYLLRPNTNGLASGNKLEEAIFHGLTEVIERDAWSLVEAYHIPSPNIQNIGDGMIGELLSKFSNAMVAVYLKDITSDIGIPTCAAASDDLKLKDPALLMSGAGTHTNANVAILRALTEVAQSRLTQIHGAREDTINAKLYKQAGYEKIKQYNKNWFDTSWTKDYREIRSYDTDDFLDDIKYILSRLKEVGIDRVIVVDLTRDEIGIPVVRVIVPGLELSTVDHERLGKRYRDAKNRNLSGAKSSNRTSRTHSGCRISPPGKAGGHLQSS